MKGVSDIMMDTHCENIGVLFDSGINELGLSPETMTYYFIKSRAAELMSNWHPRLSAGMYGMELLEWCLENSGLNPLNLLESGGISTRPEFVLHFPRTYIRKHIDYLEYLDDWLLNVDGDVEDCKAELISYNKEHLREFNRN